MRCVPLAPALQKHASRKPISEFKDYLLSKQARVTRETWERESAPEGHCCRCLKKRKLEVGSLMVQMPLLC